MIGKEDKPICFISLISRDDKPMYIQSFEHKDDTNNFLKYNFLSHMALDILASPASISIREEQQNTDITGGALLLVVQDQVTVYGYETSTGFKIVIGLDNDHKIPEKLIKELFLEVHGKYLKTICNPFLEENTDALQTGSFDKKVKMIVKNWNGEGEGEEERVIKESD